MPYSFITLAEARTVLAQRLYDSGPPNQLPAPTQFHSAPLELDLYIAEALQAFNSYAHFYRQEFTFETEPHLAWYDITSEPLSLRPMTAQDLGVLIEMEYHLLEPPILEYPLEWAGTRQFNLKDLMDALQQGRDKTLSEAGCTVFQSLVPAIPGRTFLPDNVMDVRRVCWLPNQFQRQFTPNVVLPSDLWATQSFHAGFPQRGNGTPLIYRRSTEPPVSFDVDIQPAVNGEYDLLTTNNNGALSTEHFTILPIPNDWVHVAKYGALSVLFGRESLAKDELREDYCLARYKQGTGFMQTAPAITGARINNVPVVVDSMSNIDFYFANWQGKPHAQPRYLAYSGLNMLAAVPIPDRIYSATIETVRNMPLPANDADYLQIGRDDILPVIDEAQHIAMLKLGGNEFVKTYVLHKNFLRHVALYNSKLKQASNWLEWLDERPQQEIHVNPIFQQADPTNVEPKTPEVTMTPRTGY